MPTLLSVNNYYYKRGGAETVFWEHNSLFKDHGWRVVPFSMQHPRNHVSEWSKYFVTEIEFGRNYSLVEKMRKSLSAIYSFEARGKLERLISAVKPDICHAHNMYHHISPSILSSLKKEGIPVVLTIHDLKLACPAYNMLNKNGICERCAEGKIRNVITHTCMKGSFALSCVVFVESFLHRLIGSYKHNVDRFIVPSRFYLQKFKEWGWDEKRFCQISNFVDPSAYAPNYSPGETFVYFGRLSHEKGLTTLIKAATMAKARVQIIGSGSQEGELREFAEKVAAPVSFRGFLSGEKLHEAIRYAGATVLPSECYENAPISILESYALGKPVIGALIGGIPELIRSDTGMTFQSGSAEDLAKVMRTFMGMAHKSIREMGRNGRRLVESEYTRENYMNKIRTLYSGLGAWN